MKRSLLQIHKVLKIRLNDGKEILTNDVFSSYAYINKEEIKDVEINSWEDLVKLNMNNAGRSIFRGREFVVFHGGKDGIFTKNKIYKDKFESAVITYDCKELDGRKWSAEDMYKYLPFEDYVNLLKEYGLDRCELLDKSRL